MNNYYTLIYLKKELNEKLLGADFLRAITPHKRVLEIYLETGKNTHRLIFSTDPAETALFLDRYRPPKKSNVVDFFNSLKGQKITDIKLADRDRLFYIEFNNKETLLFQLFGGSPNVFLVGRGEIVEAFKNSQKGKGGKPPQPRAPEFAESVDSGTSPKRQITRLNPLLPRNLLPGLIRQHKVDEMNVNEVEDFVEFITDELISNPTPRVLKNGEMCLWSRKVLDLESEKEFDSVNQCILYAYRNTVHTRRLNRKRKEILAGLERLHNKHGSQLEQLNQAHKSLERADEYEKYGHLLMASAHKKLEDRTEKMKVKDMYGAEEWIEIPVKPNLSVAENAEHYYEKAKSSRISFEHAKRRKKEVGKALPVLEKKIEELNAIDRMGDLEDWVRENQTLLNQYGILKSGKEQTSSPFRKVKVGKYEVWIGKNAKSNDELTGLAHKEDIWLHARGVGGSHVVIRMGNRRDFPPKQVILRAASYAAFYSKARGMRVVPVMYTKKKYVRKPKGAAPGAVVAEREQVEMVPPQKPQNS